MGGARERAMTGGSIGAGCLGACLVVLAGPAAALDLALPPIPAPCAAQGPGFAAQGTGIGGTQTCLRIGGRVRAEAGTAPRRPGREAPSPVRASGRLSIDARTPTELGPVRTFIRLHGGSPER
jgi:hypothetical protein